jgi:hypothetical protein
MKRQAYWKTWAASKWRLNPEFTGVGAANGAEALDRLRLIDPYRRIAQASLASTQVN